VGESHTRYEDHKLQLRVIRELFNRDPKLAIGMEMFPRSAQQTLDQYINGEIDEKLFLKESHYFKVWSYDYRLYREIINFARQNKIRIIALNIAKEKVSKVYKDGGISSLTPEEKIDVPVDRDLDMPYYRERINAVFSIHPHGGGATQFAGFLQAQAIWDETMAESIANYLKENHESKMVVLAGKGHVIKENAIPPRVKRRIDVSQSIVVSSDGGALYPPELDFVVFPPPDRLPPPVLIGIVMRQEKETGRVIIDALSPHGGAKKSGISKDDVLIAIDDEPISTIEQVKILMVFKQKNDKIKVNIKRPHSFFPDEDLQFEITL
jgi:aminopeptidase N